MKDSEIIAAAQELIRDPAAWCKGSWCIPGGSVDLRGQVALTDRFCIEGALREALGIQVQKIGADSIRLPDAWAIDRYAALCTELLRIGREMYPSLRASYLNGINDHTSITHDQVMDLCDKARAQMEEQGR